MSSDSINLASFFRKLFRYLSIDSKINHFNLFVNITHLSIQWISQTLLSFNIRTLYVRLNDGDLNKIPLPAIIKVDQTEVDYWVIYQVDGERMRYFSLLANKEIEVALFVLCNSKIWKGEALLLEPNQFSGQYFHFRKDLPSIKDINNLVFFIATATFLLIIGLYYSPINFYQFFFIKFIGSIISFLIVMQNSFHIPMIEKICNSSGCNKLTRASSVFMKIPAFDLSKISFAYFYGGLLSFVVLSFSGWLNFPSKIMLIAPFCSIPIIIYALYLQKVKIREWCFLCLLIISLLLTEIAISAFAWEKSVWIMTHFLALLIGFILVLSIVPFNNFSFVPSFLSPSPAEANLMHAMRLDKKIFYLSIQQSKEIRAIHDQLIILGDVAGKNTLSVILSLNCPYCSFAFEEARRLLAMNKRIKISFIIFASESKEQQDVFKWLVHVFLTSSSEVFCEALSRFLLTKKTENISAAKADDGLNIKVNAIINQNNNFLKYNKINKFPSFGYNGRIIPDYYSMREIKIILAGLN